MDVWTTILRMHQVSCISYDVASKEAVLYRSYIRRALANKTRIRIDTFAHIVHAFGFELYISDGSQSVVIRNERDADEKLKSLSPGRALAYIKHHSKVRARDISLALNRSENWLDATASYGGKPASPLFFDVVAAAQMYSFAKGYGTTIYIVGSEADGIVINDTTLVTAATKEPSEKEQSAAKRKLATYAARLLADVLQSDGKQHAQGNNFLAFNESSIDAFDVHREFIETVQPIQINMSSAHLLFSKDLSYDEIAERVDAIDKAARSISNEWGVNSLCLSLGTLHWTDSHDNIHADSLLLVQAHIFKKADGNGYTLCPCSGQVFPNPLLELRFQHGTGIRLPRFDIENGIGSFFERVKKVVKPGGFRLVTPEARLCVVPFHRAQTYQVMVAYSGTLLSNPLVHTIINPQSKAAASVASQVSENETTDPLFLLANADSYQRRAISAAHNGYSFILKGGPGTGKRQTVANIIAGSLLAGKTVLYVADKPALLSTMQKRFQPKALQRYLCSILDDRGNARELRTELGRALNSKTERTYSKETVLSLDEWRRACSQIDEYARQLTEPLQPLGASPYEVIGILWQYKKDQAKYLECEMPFVKTTDAHELQQRKLVIEEYTRKRQQLPSVVPNDDWTMLHIPWNAVDADEAAISNLQTVISSTKDLLDLHSRAQNELGIHAERTRTGMESVLETLKQESTVPPVVKYLAIWSPEIIWTESKANVDALLETVLQSIRTLSSYDSSLELQLPSDVTIDIDGIAHIRSEVTKILSAPHYLTWQAIPDNVVDNTIAPLQSQVERYNKLLGFVLQDYDEGILQLDRREVEQQIKDDKHSVIGRVFGQRTQGSAAIARYRRNRETVTQGEALTVLGRLNELSQIQQLMSDLKALYTSVLADLYQGTNSDIEHILRLRNAFSEARSLLQYLSDLEKALEVQRAETVRKATLLLHDLSNQIRVALERSDEAFSMLAAKATACNLRTMDLGDFERAATNMVNVIQHRQVMETELRLAREACVQQGLSSFIEAIDDCEPENTTYLADYYGNLFLYTFYQKWYDIVVKTTCPTIHELDKDKLISTIELLEGLGKPQQADNGYHLAAMLYNRAHSIRTTRELAGEVDKLVHALANERKPLSVRDLLTMAPQTLQVLKPCIMTSPLAVASHIGSSSVTFDIVIIDNASELRAEDALLAIGHAKQVVFVDDGVPRRQSLLTDASQLDTIVLPNHYRSLNESLIDFPNRVIYNNELRTYPTPCYTGTDIGVTVSMVEESLSENPPGTSTEEASRVVDIVFSHFAQYGTKRSVGVIVFDDCQKESIEQQLALRRGVEPKFERYFKKTLSEPFFIATANNAVGYERDTIVLSIGYTASQKGATASSLSSLTANDGTRNLITAITRARSSITIVTSVTSKQLNITHDTSDGVKLLRDYLEFAERINNPSHKTSTQATMNDTVEGDWLTNTLRTVLTKHGYIVDTHVGTKAYKVDLAVRHPQHDGWYCLGIQCDGPTYRESISAHEREQTVNATLRARGWILLHAWSEAWLSSPSEHEQTLLSSVEKVIAGFKPPILDQLNTEGFSEQPKNADTTNRLQKMNATIHPALDEPQVSEPKCTPVTIEAPSKPESLEVKAPVETKEHAVAQTPSPSYSNEQQAYLDWLLKGDITPFYAKSFVRTITTIENVIEDAGFPRPHLYGCSTQEIDAQANLCRKNPAFVERNNARYHLLTRALDSFVTYVHSQEDSETQEEASVAQTPEPEQIPQHVLDRELSDLVSKRDAQMLGRFGVYSVYDLTLFRREELLELPDVSNEVLSRVETRILQQFGIKFEIDGNAKEVRDKRRLTRDEMLVLDKPISFLETEPLIRRQLQRNAIDTCRKVAFTTIDEFLDCPGIDLETAYLLEALIGRVLGSRVFLGRQQGEIPLVAPREAPLLWRLSEQPSEKPSLSNTRGVQGLLDWVATLSSPAREHVQSLLAGDEIAGMAQKERIPISTIWSLIAKEFIGRPHLREDTFASLFRTYNLTLVEFCYITQQPPSTYRYLELIHTHGQTSVYPITSDKAFSAEYRKRASVCPLGAKTTPRPSLLTLDLPDSSGSGNSRQSVPSSMYGSGRKASYRPGTKQTIVELVDERVINGNEYAIDYLFEAIKGNDKHLYFATQTEFESSLRRAYRYDEQVSFPADGIIRFGSCDRRRQIAKLRTTLGTVDANELAMEYERRYGIGANVVRYWLREIERSPSPTVKPASTTSAKGATPSKSSARNTNRSQAIVQQLEFLRSELNADCRDRKLIVERFRARFPQGPSNPLDDATLYRLGYKRRGKKLLFKRNIDPQTYFDELITSHERFSKGDPGFELAVFNDPLFRRNLRQKMRSFEIVEYDKDSYIKLDSLCKSMPIQPEDLKGYSRAVAESVGKAVPFTIWSLRNHMHKTFPLDALATEGGVGDHLFETLLDIDPHVQTCSMGKKRCFIVAEGPITAGNVLECIIETVGGGMDFDDLRYHLKDSYGITIAELPLHNTLRQSSLFYDDLTECVFNSRREWEEMVERELAN